MTTTKFLTVYRLYCRFFLIFLFAYAALSKAIIFPQFLVQLSESPLIPSNLTYLTAVAVIAIEIGICTLLFTEKYAKLGLYSAYSLMLFFTLYILYILKLAPNIPCACGGILGNLDHSYHLAFNTIVTILIILSLWNPSVKRIYAIQSNQKLS